MKTGRSLTFLIIWGLTAWWPTTCELLACDPVPEVKVDAVPHDIASIRVTSVVTLAWLSDKGEKFDLLGCSSLSNDWVLVEADIKATPPLNQWVGPVRGDIAFYKLLVKKDK